MRGRGKDVHTRHGDAAKDEENVRSVQCLLASKMIMSDILWKIVDNLLSSYYNCQGVRKLDTSQRVNKTKKSRDSRSEASVISAVGRDHRRKQMMMGPAVSIFRRLSRLWMKRDAKTAIHDGCVPHMSMAKTVLAVISFASEKTWTPSHIPPSTRKRQEKTLNPAPASPSLPWLQTGNV